MRFVNAAGQNTSRTMRLRRAILVYTDPEQQDSKKSMALATVHDVRTPEVGAPYLLPGANLRHATLEGLVRDLQNLPDRVEYIPLSVVVKDTSQMAWWVPSGRRAIFFNTSDTGFNKALNGQHVLHPALLFVAKPPVLRIFALAENVRPGPSTALYQAPYYNLNSQGTMCRGNVTLPSMVTLADIGRWQDGFFDSRFTHSNVHGGYEKLTLFKGGHNALWRAMKKNNVRDFPITALAPTGRTLDNLLSGVF